MYKTTKGEINEQAIFCRTLMNRLAYDVNASEYAFGHIEGHTKLQTDARRIRRELLALIEMLDPWKGYDNGKE